MSNRCYQSQLINLGLGQYSIGAVENRPPSMRSANYLYWRLVKPIEISAVPMGLDPSFDGLFMKI